MNRPATKHLWTLLVCVVLSLGCFISNHRLSDQSGLYGPPNITLDGRDAHAQRPAYVPAGLGPMTPAWPPTHRIAVAELGETSVPNEVLQPLTLKGRREVISLSGKRFVAPSHGPYERYALDALQRARALSATTQSATTTPATEPVVRNLREMTEQYIAEVDAQLRVQSAAEVRRLCEEAHRQQMDVLLLVTISRGVNPSKGTAFSFLNWLILPAYLIPTDYYTGHVSANGWLLDPATGQVLRTVQWDDDYRRITQPMASEGNRRLLLEQQREDALRAVTAKLLE